MAYEAITLQENEYLIQKKNYFLEEICMQTAYI
jgi:hypothetical protein